MNLVRQFSNLIRAIIGALALIVIVSTSIFFIDERNGVLIKVLIIIISSFIFLLSSGKLKKPMYLLIIPAFIFPMIMNYYFRYENEKGTMMLGLMGLSAVIALILIDLFYARKNDKK